MDLCNIFKQFVAQLKVINNEWQQLTESKEFGETCSDGRKKDLKNFTLNLLVLLKLLYDFLLE